MLHPGQPGTIRGDSAMMDMQLLARAVLKRLLISLAIFAVGFVFVCALFRVPSADWLVAMLGALPGCVALIFVVVSVIWFIAQHLHNWQHKTEQRSRTP